MKSLSDYINNKYTQSEIQLANEIAQRLNDPAYIGQFLGFTKDVPHDVLKKFLDNACAVPDHLITSSRAAIFVSSVKKYKLYSNDYSRN